MLRRSKFASSKLKFKFHQISVLLPGLSFISDLSHQSDLDEDLGIVLYCGPRSWSWRVFQSRTNWISFLEETLPPFPRIYLHWLYGPFSWLLVNDDIRSDYFCIWECTSSSHCYCRDTQSTQISDGVVLLEELAIQWLYLLEYIFTLANTSANSGFFTQQQPAKCNTSSNIRHLWLFNAYLVCYLSIVSLPRWHQLWRNIWISSQTAFLNLNQRQVFAPTSIWSP